MNVFPFADLLADLRLRGFGIGLHEYNDVAKLAARWKGVDRVTFRDALAAVLARNADEVERIREIFDDWADDEPTRTETPRPPRPKVRTWHVVAIVLLVAAIAGAVAWRIYDERHRAKPAVTKVTPHPPVERTADDAPTATEPALPDPPYQQARERVWIAAFLVTVAAVLALAVLQTRERQRDWARRYWRHVLAHLPGPHYYEHNVGRVAPPMPRTDIDEVATILGRAREIDPADGDVLDVMESLRLTLRAGLAPHLVFQPPPRNVPVLVLQDVSWQMRPWQAKVEYFATELRRQGVLLERWYFDGDPLRVSRTPHGHLLGLEQLALARAEASVMVLSSGQAIPAESLGELERLLKKWIFRTWIHPIANREYWRRDLESLPLRVWPMTQAGVRAAAVEISRKGDAGVAPRANPPRRVTRGDVERMKQLLALVPHASLELAEELRGRFAPEVPEEVMLFLGAEGVFYGETIAIPPEQIKRLLEAASLDPVREKKIREYLLGMLRESEPAAESAAHLRWQLDEAMHRFKLGDESALTTLRALADSPLKEEVQTLLDVNDADVRVDARPPKDLPSLPPESLGKRPPLFRWPRLTHVAFALIVIVPLALLAARAANVGRGDPIPHRLGAYSLTVDDNRNLVFGTAPPGLPTNVGLYRAGASYSTLDVSRAGVVDIPDPMRGAWFEVRARLPQGNLATSYPQWVPPTRAVPVAMPAPAPWIDDEIGRHLLKTLSSSPYVKTRNVTPASLLNDLFNENGLSELVLRIGIDFRVSIPLEVFKELGTVSDLAAYVRGAVDRNKGEVSLTFLSAQGAAMYGADYTLIGANGQRIAGVGGQPMRIDAGAYRVLVGPVEVGKVDVLAGQRLDREFRVPDAPRACTNVVTVNSDSERPASGATYITLDGQCDQAVPTIRVGSTVTISANGARFPLDVKDVVRTAMLVRVTAVLRTLSGNEAAILNRLPTELTARVTFGRATYVAMIVNAGPVPPSPEVTTPRRTLRLIDPKGQNDRVEVWTETSDGTWTVNGSSSTGSPSMLLNTVGPSTVNDESGVIATDGKNQYFITNSGTVFELSETKEWDLYRVPANPPASAN